MLRMDKRKGLILNFEMKLVKRPGVVGLSRSLLAEVGYSIYKEIGRGGWASWSRAKRTLITKMEESEGGNLWLGRLKEEAGAGGWLQRVI
jgi:hypothetical protein